MISAYKPRHALNEPQIQASCQCHSCGNTCIHFWCSFLYECCEQYLKLLQRAVVGVILRQSHSQEEIAEMQTPADTQAWPVCNGLLTAGSPLSLSVSFLVSIPCGSRRGTGVSRVGRKQPQDQDLEDPGESLLLSHSRPDVGA